MNRLFILGAGFSKQAGMPLASELAPLVLEGADLKEVEDLEPCWADFKQRVGAAEGLGEDVSGFGVNVEQLFDLAMFDEELWRMNQQLAGVGREYGDTPWRKAHQIRGWLREMEEQLGHVIWTKQCNADLQRITLFAKSLLPDDTVLTFNYDTLVECALAKQNKPWNHGLADRGNGGVTVLKMHGSVDWIVLQRRPEKDLKKFVRLFSKRDTNVDEHGYQAPQEEEYVWELWRARDTPTSNAVMDMHQGGLSNFCYSLGLAGLGRYKPLHKLPGSAQTWRTGFKALKEADEIYVIGFSMSPYDTMARFHFGSVIREREEKPGKVVVVEPRAAKLAETYLSVFGRPITLKVTKAEDVDWAELMS